MQERQVTTKTTDGVSCARMRASRVLVVLIVVNVLLGVLAAGVVLSPEYAALDAAVRKGASLPRPPQEVAQAVMARPEWKRELLPRRPCGPLCRVRSAVVLQLYTDDELMRAYLAIR
jgi:hypothetical protein